MFQNKTSYKITDTVKRMRSMESATSSWSERVTTSREIFRSSCLPMPDSPIVHAPPINLHAGEVDDVEMDDPRNGLPSQLIVRALSAPSTDSMMSKLEESFAKGTTELVTLLNKQGEVLQNLESNLVEACNAKVRTLEEAHNAEVKALEESYNARVDTLTDQMTTDWNSERNILEERIKEVTAQRDTAQDRGLELVGERDEAEDEREAVCNERDDLKREIDALKAERDAKSSECDDLKRERDALTADLTRAMAIVDKVVEYSRCSVCFENKVLHTMLECNHSCCPGCIDRLDFETGNKMRCPSCRHAGPLQTHLNYALKDLFESVRDANYGEF